MRNTIYSLIRFSVVLLAVSAAFVSWSATATTNDFVDTAVKKVDLMPCFENAESKYGINKFLLIAIALHESKLDPRANNKENFDDSEDFGIMQVNSWWLNKELYKFGIKKEHLWEPCLNIDVASWILAQELQRYSNAWTAIGYYNAKTEAKRNKYINLIKNSLNHVYTLYQVDQADLMNPALPLNIQSVNRGALTLVKDIAIPQKRTPVKRLNNRKIVVVSSQQPQERG